MIERIATYRLQLNADFDFSAVTAQVDYLADLGFSHVYCSPYLQAAPGSKHGYDVVDHGRVNSELGGPQGHAKMSRAILERGMSQLLDIVPNHMAIGASNPAWSDVLENGLSSRFATYFDVDWAPPEERHRDKILLPILGDHYGKVVDAFQVEVRRDGGQFNIHYFEHRIPVSPRSLAEPLGEAASRHGSDELGFIADALEALPLATDTTRASLERRHRDRRVIREHLQRILWNDANLARSVDEVFSEINKDPDRLDAFLSRQNSRLAYWRSASRDLGYRRFFDINTLVALRVEDPQVFDETHSLPLEWLKAGLIDGVRVDHPDGLRDPQDYFRRLRAAEPTSWVVAEKILEPGEILRKDWPVEGTTGYDFLNVAGGLFVYPESEAQLTELYESFSNNIQSYEGMVLSAKQMAISELLGSDINRLTALLLAICEQHRRYRDFTRHDAHEVLKETLSALSTYRTYVRYDVADGEVSQQDATAIANAIARAKLSRPELDAALFDFLACILLQKTEGELAAELGARFQQLSGPVMAKSVEDTTFYQYARFAALNEVGGAPDRFGTNLDEFHAHCCRIQADWPETLLATSTHDTKRSEDVRARLYVLSEIPAHWQTTVTRWSERLQQYRTAPNPDRNSEYLFYQTLVGAWPLNQERLLSYMEKAVREAKVFTSWTRQDAAYESALRHFITSALADDEFVHDVQEFVGEIVEPGRHNSLSLTLIKLTAPGVPDFYQGCELWDLSLVDPDNRRPVDFATRRKLLSEIGNLDAQACMRRMDEGLPKLWLVKRGLELRRRHSHCFGKDGHYAPIYATGSFRAHAVSYSRGNDVVVVAPRWSTLLGNEWLDTTIEVPGGIWQNCLTGERIMSGPQHLSSLLAEFPVALLERIEAQQ